MYDGDLFGSRNVAIRLYVCIIPSRNRCVGIVSVRKKKRKAGNTIYSVFAAFIFARGVLGMVRQKGSYTIEAAIWIPVLLMVLSLSLEMAIDLYQEIKDATYSSKTQSLDIVQEFYNYQVLDEIIQEVNK